MLPTGFVLQSRLKMIAKMVPCPSDLRTPKEPKDQAVNHRSLVLMASRGLFKKVCQPVIKLAVR